MMFKHLKTHLNFSVDPVCPIIKDKIIVELQNDK